jgi:DNA-directed RNA polymerase
MTLRQEQFEIQSHTDAVRKLEKDLFKAKQKAYFSSTLQARETIKAATLPMADELVKFLEPIAKGRAVTTADAAFAPELLRFLDYVSPSHVTVVLLKSVLDIHGSFDNPTTSRVSNFIGGRLEDELRFRFYEITAPEEVVAAAWKRVTERGSTPRYRRVSTKYITEKMLDEVSPNAEKWPAWDGFYKCGMGLLLLTFAERFGLITIKTVRKGKKTINYVSLSQQFQVLHEECYEQLKSVAYFQRPLIEPPIPWQVSDGYSIDNTTGGYHTENLRSQLPMCRGYSYRSQFGDLSTRFLNIVGETAWCIDHSVLEIAEHLKDKGIAVGSFRAYERDQRLDDGMPPHLVALPTDHPDRKEWRFQQKRLHEYHNEACRKAVRSLRGLQEAKEFLKYPRFYLSWSNDYRGRAYPQQPWLNPQTTEFEKALIRFADGCKLDTNGVEWVKQAVGAAYLGTSLNLQDRAKWTDDNLHTIVKVGSDPLNHITEWEQAKEPWSFLQLCMEYYRVVVSKKQALWFIPIGADATASGLQLLSSMLLDPVGMKYSNVLPPEDTLDKPQDAYLEVLRVARELAAADPETEYLVQYLQKRSLGKTTMVMLYGAVHRTVVDKVIKVFYEDGLFPKVVKYKDCDAMATLLEKASAAVFPKAFKALKWLSELARIACSTSPDEFCWGTPSGDTIRLREFLTETTDIRTSHLGKVRIPVSKSRQIDHKAMRAALPPSFVHSFDAALLKISFDGWKRPLAVIHDCIRVLPTDMDRALNCIRKGFYAVANGNPLDTLATGLGVTPEMLPRLEQGEGNLRTVFEATYLFN